MKAPTGKHIEEVKSDPKSLQELTKALLSSSFRSGETVQLREYKITKAIKVNTIKERQ